MASDAPRASALVRAAWLLAGGAGVLLFWLLRIATGGSELSAAGDTLLYYYPQYLAAGEALREGRLPLWNPFQLNGHPWLATLQGGLLYPLHLVYAWLPVHAGMAVSSALHLCVAAAGAAAFARRIGLSAWAALLAALLVATQGRLPGHAGVPNLLETGAWLAPGAVAVLGIARGDRRFVALLGACLGLSLLAGYPQYSVYSCYAWAGLLLGLLAADRVPVRAWWRPALLFAAGVGLGVLLGSAQLLPSLELNALSTRADGPATHTQMFPMGWPKHSLVESVKLLAERQPTPSPFGVASLVLMPLALLAPAAATRRRAVALLALLIVVFGMALGPVSPLFELYRLLPGTGSFRLPTQRLMLVAGFLAAVVAAFGLDAAFRRVSARYGRTAGGCAAALAVGLALAEPFLTAGPRPELPYTGRGYEEIYERRQQIYDSVTSESFRVVLWNPGIPPKLPSKLGAVFGLRVFDDYEPLSLRRQAEYFGFLRTGEVADEEAPPFFGRFLPPRERDAAAVASRSRLLDLASVKWLLATNAQRHDRALHELGRALGWRREPDREKLWEVSPVLYVNDRALPRAYATYRALEAPAPDELLPRLADPRFDPLAASYVEGAPALAGSTRPGRRGHAVRITRDDATEVELTASLVDTGLVVLADTWFPGWEATVDGEPAEVLRANHLFRAVVVPGGEHVVRFRYAPAWLPGAVAGSLLGAAGVIAFAWRRGQR